MRTLITGSREATTEMLRKAAQMVVNAKNKIEEGLQECIIVGDAEGVDAQVIEMCDQLDVPCYVFGAYGKLRRKTRQRGHNITVDGTYPERDVVMAQLCDQCLGIWNGASRGTEFTTRKAKEFGREVFLWTPADGWKELSK